MVDWYGTPHSDALHVVERYRMLDYAKRKKASNATPRSTTSTDGMPVANPNGKYLQLRFTVEDPNVFTMPVERDHDVSERHW